MKAKERNKRLYNFLLYFSDGNIDAIEFKKDLQTQLDKAKIEVKEEIDAINNPTLEKINFYHSIKKQGYITKFHDTSEGRNVELIELTKAGWDYLQNEERNYAMQENNLLTLILTAVLAFGSVGILFFEFLKFYLGMYQ